MASIAASAALPTMAQNSSVPSNGAMPTIDSLAPLVAADVADDVAAQPGAQPQLRVEKLHECIAAARLGEGVPIRLKDWRETWRNKDAKLMEQVLVGLGFTKPDGLDFLEAPRDAAESLEWAVGAVEYQLLQVRQLLRN